MRLYVPVVLALVIGVALTLFALTVTRGWEEARARQDFAREVIVHAASPRQEIASTIEAVHAIRALYDASKDVERDEFCAFAAVQMEEEHPGIQALEWIPRVAAADRAAFEAAARADGLAGFGFTERESQGRMVAAAARAEYFPVYFVEPVAGNEAALGFDLGSNPARLAALEKARDSGETVATARITLVQETGDQFGFLVFEPIYRKGAPAATVAERRAALQGFGLGVLRIGDIVDAAMMHRGPTKAVVMDMFVFDIAAPAGKRLLYPKSAPVQDRADIGVAGCVDTPLRVGGRDWLLVHCPVDGMMTTGRWQSWTVLVTGLAITGMLALYLLKPGKLDSGEVVVMKQHAEIGHGILSRSDHSVIRCAANIAWAHHERWDGGGYPRGLKGDEIPSRRASSPSATSTTRCARSGPTSPPSTTKRRLASCSTATAGPCPSTSTRRCTTSSAPTAAP